MTSAVRIILVLFLLAVTQNQDAHEGDPETVPDPPPSFVLSNVHEAAVNTPTHYPEQPPESANKPNIFVPNPIDDPAVSPEALVPETQPVQPVVGVPPEVAEPSLIPPEDGVPSQELEPPVDPAPPGTPNESQFAPNEEDEPPGDEEARRAADLADAGDFDEGRPPSSEEDGRRDEEEEEPSASVTESNKSEDSIPSFSEWTQLQLSQRKEAIINNIKNKTSLQEGKNFASPDCGAKVINSNPEAQNPSGVISSSHDEYMLNRCTSNTWFILELCEPLKIEKVSIGNLELFSSNPHEFELGVSDRYPTREWTIVGPYFAPDARSMHSFLLPTNNSTFGKFLRILVRSHHGNEHYCPLSVVKVFGKSEYEVLESETTHAEDVESNSIIEDGGFTDDKPVGKSVLGSATEAVMDMIEKAASALINKDKSQAEPDEFSSSTPSLNSTSTSCITLSQCIPESEFKELITRKLSCNAAALDWLQDVIPWCGWDYCHNFFKTNSIGSPGMPEGLFAAIYGQSIMETLCHYLRPVDSCELVEEKKDLVQLTSGVPNDTATADGKDRVIYVPPPASPGPGDGTGDSPLSSTPPVLPSPPLPPSTFDPSPSFEEPAQKESVFVRLSNRIKNLERNQSLSSGYLEELSRRFKKQNEDLNTSHDMFRKTLNESLTKCRRVEENLRYEVRKLNRNLENLRELLWRVEMQRGGLVLFSVLQFLFTVFCWWSRDRKGTGVHSVTPDTGLDQASAEHLLLQRKRTNSETLKKVKKKKKRKEGGPKKSRSVSPVPNSSTSVTSGAPFEFKSPLLLSSSRAASTNSAPPVLPNHPNSNSTSYTVLNPGSSLSDLSVSGESVQRNTKKKSKLRALFFGNK